MALGGQIVNFLRLNLDHQPGQRTRIRQIAVMQKKPLPAGMRILINRFEPPRVKRARPADDAVNFIALGQQQLRQIRTVLSGDASNQCAFRHKFVAATIRNPGSKRKPRNHRCNRPDSIELR
jgi:hypothetical protein